MVLCRIFKFSTLVVDLRDSGFFFKLLKVTFSQKHCTTEDHRCILSKILLIALSSVLLSRLSAIDISSMNPTVPRATDTVEAAEESTDIWVLQVDLS